VKNRWMLNWILFSYQFPVWDRDRRLKASPGCVSRRQCWIWWLLNWHHIIIIWTRRDVCLP